MIHPGNGTSLLPLELLRRHHFPNSQHVVLDISEVAIEEMKQIHHHSRWMNHTNDTVNNHHHYQQNQQQNQQQNHDSKQIQYEIMDVLHPPLPLDDESFHVWIDKGFLDAVFSKEMIRTTTRRHDHQASQLFREAQRILVPRGIVLVVTLAEDHSLRILLEPWNIGHSLVDSGWSRTLHVWELNPISGDFLPFCFVYTKHVPGETEATTATTTVPVTDDIPTLNVFWHFMDGSTDSWLFSVTEDEDQDESLYNQMKKRIEDARGRYASQLRTAADVSSDNVRRVLATIEVKPVDSEVDVARLGHAILSAAWHSGNEPSRALLTPKWMPFDDANDKSGQERFLKIVPIGYGISKLVLQCVIESEHLDELVEAIGDCETSSGNCQGVQSVDIDWERTLPVSDARSFASQN